MHETVNRSIGKYVKGQAHTNGIESFWSLMKCGYYDTYHKMRVKLLGRYADEFAGRHNARPLDTIEQMARVAKNMDSKRLTYKALVG